MTDDELEAIRARHEGIVRPQGWGCLHCVSVGKCDTMLALDALAHSETALRFAVEALETAKVYTAGRVVEPIGPSAVLSLDRHLSDALAHLEGERA